MIQRFPDGLFADNSNSDVIIGNQGGGGNDYAGLIDEVAIYNRTLTASEILSHYNKINSGDPYCNVSVAEAPAVQSECGYNETLGIVSYWPFEEGTGSTTADIISGNDGALESAAAFASDRKVGNYSMNFSSGSNDRVTADDGVSFTSFSSYCC